MPLTIETSKARGAKTMVLPPSCFGTCRSSAAPAGRDFVLVTLRRAARTALLGYPLLRLGAPPMCYLVRVSVTLRVIAAAGHGTYTERPYLCSQWLLGDGYTKSCINYI